MSMPSPFLISLLSSFLLINSPCLVSGANLCFPTCWIVVDSLFQFLLFLHMATSLLVRLHSLFEVPKILITFILTHRKALIPGGQGP